MREGRGREEVREGGREGGNEGVCGMLGEGGGLGLGILAVGGCGVVLVLNFFCVF